MEQGLVRIIQEFVNEEVTVLSPINDGLINSSFMVQTNGGKYVLQKINQEVFEQPHLIMENIERVHAHLKGAFNYYVPEMIQLQDKKWLVQDESGASWRLMRFIANSRTFNTTTDESVAEKAGGIVGQFHFETRDLSFEDLHTILPNFHSLQFRSDLFLGSIQNARKERLQQASECIVKAEEWMDRLSAVEDLTLPIRVTHNDTKLNNILFDKDSGDALCLIDLDTLMPGHIHHDFGDAIRTLCNTTAEDESDLSLVEFDWYLFTAFSKGYLEKMKGELEESEWEALPKSIALMPFIMGLRFLTDFLYDDVYYKVTRENQNLDRCKNQFALLDQIDLKDEAITDFISAFRPS